MKYRGWTIKKGTEYAYDAYRPDEPDTVEWSEDNLVYMKEWIDDTIDEEEREKAEFEYNESIDDDTFVRIIDGSLGITINEQKRGYGEYYHDIMILSTGQVISVFLNDFRIISNQDKPHCLICRVSEGHKAQYTIRNIIDLTSEEKNTLDKLEGFNQTKKYDLYVDKFDNLQAAHQWFINNTDFELDDTIFFDFPSYGELDQRGAK